MSKQTFQCLRSFRKRPGKRIKQKRSYVLTLSIKQNKIMTDFPWRCHGDIKEITYQERSGNVRYTSGSKRKCAIWRECGLLIYFTLSIPVTSILETDGHRYFLIYALAILKHIWFPSFSYHEINFISKFFIYFIYLSVMIHIKHSPIV